MLPDPFKAYFAQPLEVLALHLKESTGITEPVSAICSKLSGDDITKILKRITLCAEFESGYRDMHGRFDEQHAPERLDVPIVNELLAERGLTVKTPPGFRIVFTHDIDWVSPWHPVSWVKSFKDIVSPSKYWVTPFQNLDPRLFAKTISKMLDMEAESRLRAVYFMMSGPAGLGRFDSRYSIREKSAAQILDDIRAHGAVTGLHASYEAADNNSYASEKKEVEAAAGTPVIAQRNHYLRFHPWLHASQLSEAGIRYDMSVGYTSYPGFRSGLCTPYRLIDTTKNEVSGVTEIPLLMMERSRHLEEGPALFERYNNLLKEVKKYNGTVSVLTHPENFCVIPDFWNFYRRLIDGALSNNAIVNEGF